MPVAGITPKPKVILKPTRNSDNNVAAHTCNYTFYATIRAHQVRNKLSRIKYRANADLPFTLRCRLIIPRCREFRLPLDRSWFFQQEQESASTLLALSRTSRRLREIVLPELWNCVTISTVKELGKLSELLEALPSIAPHIHSFGFSWDMGGDCYEGYWSFPEKEGRTIDLAFSNRLELWERLRDASGCEVKYQSRLGSRTSLPTLSTDVRSSKHLEDVARSTARTSRRVSAREAMVPMVKARIRASRILSSSSTVWSGSSRSCLCFGRSPG